MPENSLPKPLFRHQCLESGSWSASCQESSGDFGGASTEVRGVSLPAAYFPATFARNPLSILLNTSFCSMLAMCAASGMMNNSEPGRFS